MHGWKKLQNISNTHLHRYDKQDQFFFTKIDVIKLSDQCFYNSPSKIKS